MATIASMSMRGTVLTESGNLVHRSPPDFLYSSLFGVLSLIHASIAFPAFIHGRWEGCLSMFFFVFFGVAAVICRRFRVEIAVLKNERQIRVRHGVGRFCFERRVPFRSISNVRLTLLGGADQSEIELLGRNHAIRYPSAEHPRQEALLLAMTINVPLVKVYGEHVVPDDERSTIPSRDRAYEDD